MARQFQVIAFLALFVVGLGHGAPADLEVRAKFPDEPTGTMHYAEAITLAIGNATPLVLEGRPMLPIPGPHFRLANSRFLLLGWSSIGSGMQTMHVLLISVRHSDVVLDRELTVMTDRGSAGLLIRLGKHSARIGFPQPPSDFVHDEDEWFLNLGTGESLDLQHMRRLLFARVNHQKGDLFYNGSTSPPSMLTRVAWIDVTANGFALRRSAQRH